ncbi:TPA: hypothetical protein ACH3X1_015245 [Trebouxia sp. C0004]
MCHVVAQSYLNAAARTDASLVKFPPASMQPHPQPKASTSAQPVPALMALNSEEAGTNQAAGMSASVVSTDAAGTAPTKRRKMDSKPATTATVTPLLDDDIDWAASSGACEHPLADSDATDAQGQQDVTLAQQQSEPMHASDYVQEAAVEAAAEAEAAPEACRQLDVVSDNQAGSQENSDQGLVQHAVAEYVRALLDPFYKAGIVDREMYKLVFKKAVAKIVQNHSSAEDTDFVIQESEQIQKLVRDYIRYAQKKLHK